MGLVTMFSDVRDHIVAQLTETGTPSLAVSVAQYGKILWEEGFGWADGERRVASTAETVYSLASISKPITATGLMVLVERGELDLESPINSYLGDAKLTARVGNADAATVRRVANHTSGLPVHCQFFYEDEAARPPGMDETIRRYGNLVTVPGEHFQYSNLGYGLLDYVICRLSGRSYEEFMREEVFLPLGMTQTSVQLVPETEAHVAVRYGSDGLPLPFYDFDHRGASAVFSSAHDLARFGMFHLKAHVPDQSPILSDDAIDDMQRPRAVANEVLEYGSGWRVCRSDMGFRTISHAGGMGGVSTLLTLVPSEGLAVAALANGASSLPQNATRKLMATLLPGYARACARHDADRESAADTAAAAAVGFEPPAELVSEWHGAVHTYEGERSYEMRIEESGACQVRLGCQPTSELSDVAFSDGWLTGNMTADIGTEDANRYPHHLQVKLKLRGEVLNGVVTTVPVPKPRVGNTLSHWAELRRTS